MHILAVCLNHLIEILRPLLWIWITVPSYGSHDSLNLEHIRVCHKSNGRLHIIRLHITVTYIRHHYEARLINIRSHTRHTKSRKEEKSHYPHSLPPSGGRAGVRGCYPRQLPPKGFHRPTLMILVPLLQNDDLNGNHYDSDKERPRSTKVIAELKAPAIEQYRAEHRLHEIV